MERANGKSQMEDASIPFEMLKHSSTFMKISYELLANKIRTIRVQLGSA